jgi:hypothetical protein
MSPHSLAQDDSLVPVTAHGPNQGAQAPYRAPCQPGQVLGEVVRRGQQDTLAKYSLIKVWPMLSLQSDQLLNLSVAQMPPLPTSYYVSLSDLSTCLPIM